MGGWEENNIVISSAPWARWGLARVVITKPLNAVLWARAGTPYRQGKRNCKRRVSRSASQSRAAARLLPSARAGRSTAQIPSTEDREVHSPGGDPFFKTEGSYDSSVLTSPTSGHWKPGSNTYELWALGQSI